MTVLFANLGVKKESTFEKPEGAYLRPLPSLRVHWMIVKWGLCSVFGASWNRARNDWAKMSIFWGQVSWDFSSKSWRGITSLDAAGRRMGAENTIKIRPNKDWSSWADGVSKQQWSLFHAQPHYLGLELKAPHATTIFDKKEPLST